MSKIKQKAEELVEVFGNADVDKQIGDTICNTF